MAVSMVIRGATLGEAFAEVIAVLYDTVKNVGNKDCSFKPHIQNLESTLDRLLPMIKDIKLLSQQLDCPEEETLGLIEEMKKGEKLVRKCSKILWWNYCFKVHYAIKLCELDEDIARFGQVDLQMRKTTLVQMLCPDDKIEGSFISLFFCVCVILLFNWLGFFRKYCLHISGSYLKC